MSSYRAWCVPPIMNPSATLYLENISLNVLVGQYNPRTGAAGAGVGAGAGTGAGVMTSGAGAIGVCGTCNAGWPSA